MPTKKPKTIDYENFGMHGGRHDLERWGVFAEMTYLHGKGTTAAPSYSNDERIKGRQLFPGFPKWKTELQDCYFDHEFKRIFIGEALNSVYKRDAKARLEGKAKFLTPGGMRPPETSKTLSSPGDFYGTFGGVVQAFDPRKRKNEKGKGQEGSIRPIMTRPGKKGGSGYVDITINKFPEWMPEKYDRKVQKEGAVAVTKDPFRSGQYPRYFDENPYLTPNPIATYRKLREIAWAKSGTFFPPKAPAKLDGMKGGCFSKYPIHSSDKYYTSDQIEKMTKKAETVRGNKKFIPSGAGKTYPIYSVASLNVDFRTNAQNFAAMKPVTYGREFLHEIEF